MHSLSLATNLCFGSSICFTMYQATCEKKLCSTHPAFCGTSIIIDCIPIRRFYSSGSSLVNPTEETIANALPVQACSPGSTGKPVYSPPGATMATAVSGMCIRVGIRVEAEWEFVCFVRDDDHDGKGQFSISFRVEAVLLFPRRLVVTLHQCIMVCI
jgi:hypothetical protein